MATYTLDWSETDLGGSAVTSYGSGAVLDFTDKPAAATSALSLTAHQSDGVDNILAEFTIETTGSSVMTFDYKVSTESGWDKFHIDVDGVSQANYSGLVAWTSHAGMNIASAGVHTIRFRYTKDPGGSGNADRVWVALLNITNTVTTNDASGTVDTSDMEDGAIPAAVTTSTWTNSTSEPIAGTRSLRSPAAPANSGSYDLTVTKPAGSDYATVGFNYKVSSEAGWDKLFIFPDATATNVPASGSPSTPGESGWLDYSGSQSGRLAVILPAAESTILLRYTKDGGGAAGSDAAWIDTLSLPAAAGDPAGEGTATGSWSFTGSASGKRTPKATATGTLAYTGSATGQRSPKGSAAGSLSWTGSATGQRTPKGSASGTYAYAGSAVGEAPVVGSASGTATGSWGFTGSATGRRDPKGGGTGSYAYTGSAVGTAPAVDQQSGTASGAWAFTGAAVGKRAPVATAVGTLAYVGTATGTTTRTGTATGTWAYTGTAQGSSNVRDIDATATLAARPTTASLAARSTVATLAARRTTATLEEQ